MQNPDPVIYQLKVVLQDISPMIWRRLLVCGDTTIADLHYIIQIAMGWSDYHLHQFRIHGKRYGICRIGGISFSDDPHTVGLKDLRLRINERFYYEYDFTDDWQHLIRVEAILDWFHITMRLTVMCQMAKGLGPPGFELRDLALKELERIKWFLWHGNTFRALHSVEDLLMDIDVEDPTPKQRKLLRKLEEFETYIRNNAGFIPNYGERWRYGDTISTAFVESTINQVVPSMRAPVNHAARYYATSPFLVGDAVAAFGHVDTLGT